jgi:hypothetical protein
VNLVALHIDPDDEVSEMLVFNQTLTRLSAREDFIAFIQHESFKFYIKEKR